MIASELDSAISLSLAAASNDSPRALAILGPDVALDFASVKERVDRSHPRTDRVEKRVLRPDVDSVLAWLGALDGRYAIAAIHPRWTESETARRLELLERDVPSLAISDDLALVVFSSGTSGASKPIAISRRAFSACASISLRRLAFGPGDRFWLGLPLAHVGGASIVARALAARATVVVEPTPFSPESFLDTVARFGVTHASVVPTMLRRLVDAGEAPPGCLRRLVVGGAACSDDLARRAYEAGFPVVRTYGMTETCAMIACEARPLEGGVGQALESVSIDVVDGEIRVATPTLASGIWPDLALPLDERGRLRCGDEGRLDDVGCLHVAGRRDDVVVTGGENVHPAEVEAALLAIDGVADAVVFGEPDETWGARVVAAIVVADPNLVATVERRAKDGLATFARPRRYVAFDRFPTLPSGKTDRRAVIEASHADDPLAARRVRVGYPPPPTRMK